jgi:septal ring factor EnvC (AmiA/AmiB activator)
MATKHQLEQQLEETRADLEAEVERHNRCKDREADLSRKLRDATTEQAKAEEMSRQQAARARNLEADVARLQGQLEGMRYMIRLEKGIEPFDEPIVGKVARDFEQHFTREFPR